MSTYNAVIVHLGHPDFVHHNYIHVCPTYNKFCMETNLWYFPSLRSTLSKIIGHKFLPMAMNDAWHHSVLYTVAECECVEIWACMEAEKGNFLHNWASAICGPASFGARACNLQRTSIIFASLYLAGPLRIITVHSYNLVIIALQ